MLTVQIKNSELENKLKERIAKMIQNVQVTPDNNVVVIGNADVAVREKSADGLTSVWRVQCLGGNETGTFTMEATDDLKADILAIAWESAVQEIDREQLQPSLTKTSKWNIAGFTIEPDEPGITRPATYPAQIPTAGK